ncbi:SPOSA6832_01851, partial [Sporobolomyces salmonicolor]
MLWTPSWNTAREAKDTERRLALELGGRLLSEYATGISSDLDTAILSANAAQIVDKSHQVEPFDSIKTKQPGWTATNVMLVFIRSAIEAQERSNLLTEILFNPALKHAQDLDAEFEKTGKIVGPLHGVPVSLKDQIDLKDVDTTMGFTQQAFASYRLHLPRTNLLLLTTARSTIPPRPMPPSSVPCAGLAQSPTMLSFECANPLFGASRNPYDSSRTPGGSSGGEAGLLGSDGSPMGFGSDVGGSLRIPCHYSGCFALKPCFGRFPSTDCRGTNPGFEAIKASMGPMGRSVADVELASRVVLDASVELARTEALVPLPYREVKLPRKLKFGYYLTDGFCHASPACERAVLETVEALRKQGHECVEFTPPSPIEAMELFVALTSAGGCSCLSHPPSPVFRRLPPPLTDSSHPVAADETLLAGLRGDPQEASLWLVTLGPSLPSFVRTSLAWVVEHVVGDPVLARLFRASRRKSVFEILELDAILCAPQATPALKHGQTWDLSPAAIGTILYNVVDSSVGLVPVSFVSSTLDAVTPSWLSTRRARAPVAGSKLAEQRMYGPRGGVYDAKAMEGLPVGVQVVGGHWDEERVVELMKVVDRALGPRGFGPGEFVKRQRKKMD